MVDLTNITIAQDLNENLQDTYNTLINACLIEDVNLTEECGDLLQRISNCPPPSLASLRILLMNNEEFSDGKLFDPFLHNDYEFVHDIVFHL